MKPFNPGGHAAYQKRVLTQLRKYYPDAISSLPASTWDIMEKFWALDLSELDSLMQDRYSVFGPAPRLPSDMLRSILLSVEFKVSSYTKWAADLKENHLHAILSGFFIGDTPGTGTFYDFQGRLWLSDKDNLSDSTHPPKEKPQKPDKKGDKAPSVEKVTVKDLFQQFETAPPLTWIPANSSTKFLRCFFLNIPYRMGWLTCSAFPLPVMAPLFIPLHRNEKNAPVTVWKRGSMTACATAFTANPTVTSAGIPIGTAITLAMIYTCLLPPIRKMTSRFSLSSAPLPGMIPSVSFITGFP